ncbi:MAG: hypothetical protein K6E29_08090 [Cyanobacteria bacterium RUI128]|nr:hypothetical protein [Cyanobacteria bacterium RUI128]
MVVTKEEVENILSGVKDGDKVLNYIAELEEHHHCHCHDDEHEHHHEHHCDCGCEDEEEDEWEEIKTGYKNKLTVEDWEELLKDKDLFNKDALIILKRMRHVAAPTSSAELADMFGLGALYYSLEMGKLAKSLCEKLNIDYLEDIERWSVLFVGWNSKDLYNTQIYALRPELYEALGNTDLSAVPLRGN